MSILEAPFFTVAEASLKLDGMEPRIIRRYCAKRIVGTKLGRDWVLSETDVATLAEFKSRSRGNPNWKAKKAVKKPRKKRRKRE